MSPEEVRGIVQQTLFGRSHAAGNEVSFPMAIVSDEGKQVLTVIGLRAWDGVEFSFAADLVDNLMIDGDDLCFYMTHFHDDMSLIEDSSRRNRWHLTDIGLERARNWIEAWMMAILPDVEINHHGSSTARRFLYEGFMILLLPPLLDEDDDSVLRVRAW